MYAYSTFVYYLDKKILPKLFKVKCVEDEFGFSQYVARFLSGKLDALGHFRRVTTRSLALNPHLQVHGCVSLTLGPVMHSLRDIEALPARLMNGNQPGKP